MDYQWIRILSLLTVLLIPEISCKPTGSDPVHILRYENTQSEDNYKFDFHTSDGQKREETGILINGGQELLVRGSYSYTGTDNKVYMVEYVADRNGFHPKVTILEGEEEEIPAITLAGYDPDSNIRPHALKSLLGK